jgi:hypothetical protein
LLEPLVVKKTSAIKPFYRFENSCRLKFVFSFQQQPFIAAFKERLIYRQGPKG